MQYYHGNHLHSASVITDGYGNTKETIEYHPYGTYRLRTDLDPSFPNVNYTFTDQEEDDEAGLYNYKARLYDPLLGRFISADSIVPEPGNLQAYNRYSYCLNNPVVYSDPSGQFSLGDVFNAFITGVVAAVVFWATGGAGTPGMSTFIAGIAAGAAGGATASALSGGNLQGILQGAVMGAVIGGATGGLLGGIGAEYGASAMQWAGYGVMAAGGGAAYASGGLDGLAYYAAGMLGAMAGGYVAEKITATQGNESGGASSTKNLKPRGVKPYENAPKWSLQELFGGYKPHIGDQYSLLRDSGYHTGIDAKPFSLLGKNYSYNGFAPGDLFVVNISSNSTCGNFLTVTPIGHADLYITFCHSVAAQGVEQGTAYFRDDWLFTADKSGISTGYHTHIEMRYKGYYHDPNTVFY